MPDKETVALIIGFLTLVIQSFLQYYFKDRADARRTQETATALLEKEEELARVTKRQSAMLAEKIIETKQAVEENTTVSTNAFDAANNTKAALAETNRSLAKVSERSVDKSQDVLEALSREFAELKELVKNQTKKTG